MNTRSVRRPPHPDVGDQPYFVTTRCADSVILDERARDVAKSELLRLAALNGFILIAYVFMPDHAHLVVVPAPGYSISQTMRVIKGGTARAVNSERRVKGAVWQDGFYDRVARTLPALNAFVTYVHNNPVRAGIARTASDYAWSSGSEALANYQRYLDTVREGGLGAQVPRGLESPRYSRGDR